jgi:2-amino-4-hydroxy-6-hydroxymethyldihydropteridine diphosphokinase
LIGSNQDNPFIQLSDARQRLEMVVGPILNASLIYQTAAWGMTDQPDFLNQVLKFESDQHPEKLMHSLLGIEAEMGRIRSEKNAPRNIDIDILAYGNLFTKTETVQIPHPRIELRRFVLIPLKSINPNWIHPITMKTIDQLLAECPDDLPVHIFIPSES